MFYTSMRGISKTKNTTLALYEDWPFYTLISKTQSIYMIQSKQNTV